MTERYTIRELSKMYGVTDAAVRKKLNRNGILPDDNKKYSHAEYIKAVASGKQMDRDHAAKQLADVESAGDTLQTKLLRRKVKLLDIEIKTAEAKLAEMLNKVIDIEKHREHCEAIARLMVTWWDRASENAATRVKDAVVLDELRKAGERAREEILEFT